MPRKLRPTRVRCTYEFIKAHQHKHAVQVMCRLLASPQAATTHGSRSRSQATPKGCPAALSAPVIIEVCRSPK